jgi:predicted restriction endonuclease
MTELHDPNSTIIDLNLVEQRSSVSSHMSTPRDSSFRSGVLERDDHRDLLCGLRMNLEGCHLIPLGRGEEVCVYPSLL